MSLYDVFISYSRFDTLAVSSLIARLRHDIPGLKIWFDIEGIESADAFKRKIINAINQSNVVIFACSDNSLASEFCEKEVTYAKNIGKKVIPYLLPDSHLKDWLLFDFGNINCIHSSKEDEVARMIDDLKCWKRRQEGMPQESTVGANSTADPSSLITAPTITAPTITAPLTLPLQSSTLTSLQSASPAKSSSVQASENDPTTKEESGIGTIKGHTYVDLGLPSGVKWATTNIGASSVEGYGEHFAWSDIEAKTAYDPSNCQTYKKDIDWLRGYGYIGARKQLEMSHDVARQQWGGTWRMPSRKEIEELLQNTIWEWVMRKGTNGYQVQSRINGNRIFIPASGYCEGKKLHGLGDMAQLWSCSANDGAYELSFALCFTSRKYYLGMFNRYLGFSVRPVTD